VNFLLTIFGFILLIPVVIVAAVLLLGAGAGIITRIFSIEMIGIAAVVLLLMLVKKIFK
jgi:hypothetical protein